MQKNNYFSKHAIVKLCTTDTKIKFQKCTIWKLWWMDLQKNRQNVTHHGITQLTLWEPVYDIIVLRFQP